MEEKSNRPKSPQVAILLSGVIPGSGHLYNEDWVKGVLFLVASIFLDSFLLPADYLDVLRLRVPYTRELAFQLLTLALFRIYCIYDADRSVKKKNAAALSASSK